MDNAAQRVIIAGLIVPLVVVVASFVVCACRHQAPVAPAAVAVAPGGESAGVCADGFGVAIVPAEALYLAECEVNVVGVGPVWVPVLESVRDDERLVLQCGDGARWRVRWR